MRWLFLILFILGCSKTPTPKWYLNTPNDNALYIYGSAEGKTKQEAINNALNFIASKLQVKINSTFESEKSLIQNNNKTNTYKNISQNIKTSIENFTFYNYQLDKIQKIDDKYYVLVKINRQKNAKKILDSIKEELNNTTFSNSAIEKIKIYKNEIKKLNNLKNQYKIAKILNPNIEKINIDSKINSLKQKLQNITFNVYSNNDLIKKSTQNFLSQSGFLISNNPKIKIKLNLTTSTKKIVGEYLTTATLNATILDKSTSKNLFFECSANSFNKELSKKLAIRKCSNKLNNALNKIFN